MRYEKYTIQTYYGEWYPPITRDIFDVQNISDSYSTNGYASYNFQDGKFNFQGLSPITISVVEGENDQGVYTQYFNEFNERYIIFIRILGDTRLNNLTINAYRERARRSSREERGTYVETIIAENGTYPDDGTKVGFWWVKKGPVNMPPIISGKDSNIGNKYSPFDIKYSINDTDDTSFTVMEMIDGINLKTFTANKNTEYKCTIPDKIFYSLTDGQHTIKIEVEDSAGNKATRMCAFNKIYIAPVISGKNEDIGLKNSSFGVKYTMTCDNPEANTFTVEERLDDLILRKFDVVKNIEYTVAVQDSTFYKLENGQHTITIKVHDKGNIVIRQYTFTKNEKSIQIQLSKVIDIDRQGKSILITPEWNGIDGNEIKVEVTNNAYDLVPTWEEATNAVKSGKEYVFENNIKTADKWGINIRFLINKISNTGVILIKGFKAEVII
ncbi:Ig-like domain-containing protein [Clostridium lundense]|uniref:Ig-like domain-containing protein n=1 Tax=Clostridium lundense TaxID=319475 RepID=UPI00048361E0|nr:Ig-like domain-containing protein [Clostridium lundense]